MCVWQGRLQSQDLGKHLAGVEDLLQLHELVEADIAVQAERVRAVSASALRFCDPGKGENWGEGELEMKGLGNKGQACHSGTFGGRITDGQVMVIARPRRETYQSDHDKG